MAVLVIDGVPIAEVNSRLAEFLKNAAKSGLGAVLKFDVMTKAPQYRGEDKPGDIPGQYIRTETQLCEADIKLLFEVSRSYSYRMGD